jgi:hypothetical protein
MPAEGAIVTANRSLRLVLIPLLFLLSFAYGAAQGVERESLEFIVVMESGDSFRGNVVSYTDSTLTIQTEFNRVVVAKSLVKEFIPVEGSYLKRPQHFLMPTASPSGPGVFISNYELGFFYGGVGIGEGATLTAGFSTIPTISLSSQIYHMGAKFTVQREGPVQLAVGATYSFLTTREPYAHLYAVTTTKLGTGRWSAMLFYKISGAERAPIEVYGPGTDTTKFTLFYEGALGAALGLDAPLFGRDDMGLFAEIWNNDLTKPQNTASVIGVRVFNERASADFGVSLIAGPYVVPVMSFTWHL